MKRCYIICLVVILITSCNNNYHILEDEDDILFERYDGNWRIDDILAYYFIDSEKSEEINIQDDKYLGSQINIDATNNKIMLNGDDTYTLLNASEVTSEELMHILFAPDGFSWSFDARDLSRMICGGVYDEEGNISEGKSVLFFRFKNIPDDLLYPEYLSFIITDDNNLLVFIGEAVGTYTLKRE